MKLLVRIRDTALGKVFYQWLCRLLPPIPISRRVWGLKVYFNLRDCLFYLSMSKRELESLEGPVLDILKRANGPVWDVGSNVGLFSLFCASRGLSVTAFDISDTCIQLLKKSASANNLVINVVPTALSVVPFTFTDPGNAHTMNSVARNRTGTCKQSMTFEEAARQFGIPDLIKMDIEGAEIDFLLSDDFKKWVDDNKVVLLIEVHNQNVRDAVWKDVPFVVVDDRHVLISATNTKGA